MIFENRQEAGRRLASNLAKFKNHDDVIVLGIPRGGSSHRLRSSHKT